MGQNNNSRSESFEIKKQINRTDLIIRRLEGRVSSLENQIKLVKGQKPVKLPVPGNKGVSI